MCGKTMHYDWAACAAAEAWADKWGSAHTFATLSQLTDDATHKHLPCRYMPGGKLPFPTQGEIVDGVYAAMSGGFHVAHERIVAFHFPTSAKLDGLTGPGGVDTYLDVAAEDVKWAISDLEADPGDVRLRERLDEKLARAAILAHGVLDEHAHSTFCGMPAASNGRPWSDRSWYDILPVLMPDRLATGHSEYKTLPDTVGKVWRRNGYRRNNCVTFLQAGVALWNCLRPDLAVEVFSAQESMYSVCPKNPSGFVPQCVTLLTSTDATTDERLKAACLKLYATLTGNLLEEYRVLNDSSSLWYAFQQAALGRLVEVLQ